MKKGFPTKILCNFSQKNDEQKELAILAEVAESRHFFQPTSRLKKNMLPDIQDELKQLDPSVIGYQRLEGSYQQSL
ncbi:uncharacterized protein PADG_01137 [Paracoccidioides brasiliensis Pb18]|uniref:Uncharacterized protein n=2 Tax=Paracoccidioides brasiliensis TaxID=121759 RepID=C1FZB1_PARBD|nr:uncharacterized protein PADG_01137 [Paracoccidioides brasiliensis Pb18]EEH44848.2 hypothetical protein PADG_01137 [Paracoccidioides brasiliensis Pb18]ODH25800.1 hypothetical protein ACO22_05035 [Paracoccidioides brasiliensis]ODH49144.1 hypothetical protein GX48_04762 [Paracoccidioides brasiliensis]